MRCFRQFVEDARRCHAEQIFLEVRTSIFGVCKAEGFAPSPPGCCPGAVPDAPREDAIIMRRALATGVVWCRTPTFGPMPTRDDPDRPRASCALARASAAHRRHLPRVLRLAHPTSRRWSSCPCVGPGARAHRPASPNLNGTTSRDVDACVSRAPEKSVWYRRCPCRVASGASRGRPSSDRPEISTTCSALGMNAGENIYIANCQQPTTGHPEPSRRLSSLPRPADRTDRAEADRRAGHRRRCSASTRRSRACAGRVHRYQGVPARRDLPPGVPAARLPRQGEGVGGSALGPAHAAWRGGHGPRAGGEVSPADSAAHAFPLAMRRL